MDFCKELSYVCSTFLFFLYTKYIRWFYFSFNRIGPLMIALSFKILPFWQISIFPSWERSFATARVRSIRGLQFLNNFRGISEGQQVFGALFLSMSSIVTWTNSLSSSSLFRSTFCCFFSFFTNDFSLFNLLFLFFFPKEWRQESAIFPEDVNFTFSFCSICFFFSIFGPVV